MDSNTLRAWIVLKKHFSCWVVSFGRMTLDLCLIFLIITYVVHAWELGSDQTLVFHSPSLKTHSGNWEV